MQFEELNVIPNILKALEQENYAVPTPIQEKAIPLILSGRDLLGCAQTGTGKTAAFAIPTLQLLSEEKTPYAGRRNIRALVVTPTRELALQIHENFCTYGEYTKLKSCVIFGGVSQKPQEKALRQGVDILIATPGRLNDLINQKLIDLKHIKIFILDEADRMLDMGFIVDINKILSKMPADRQTLFFSATMPSEVAKLANGMLSNPAKVKITPESSTVDTIEQYLYYVDKHNKKDLLLHLLKDDAIASVLVFTRTKHGADRLMKQLAQENVIAQAIHADKSQGARQNALSNFKNKTLRVLIATDIAARGIDVDELSHVINFDMPNAPETYVHRIGRTGRAGLGGVAISFCSFDEKDYLADIEKLIRKHLIEVKDHPYPLMNNFPEVKTTQPRSDASRNDKSPTTSRKKSFSKSTANSKSTDSSTSTSKPTWKSASKNKASSTSTAPKKKYVMTADGTLREKKSFSKFSRKPNNDSSYPNKDKKENVYSKNDNKGNTYSKKKNYKGK